MFAIVEAGGVGYDVTITIPTFSDLPATGSEVALYIHTHVREDALQLFGFHTRDEQTVFELLQGVSGIGPCKGTSMEFICTLSALLTVHWISTDCPLTIWVGETFQSRITGAPGSTGVGVGEGVGDTSIIGIS